MLIKENELISLLKRLRKIGQEEMNDDPDLDLHEIVEKGEKLDIEALDIEKVS